MARPVGPAVMEIGMIVRWLSLWLCAMAAWCLPLSGAMAQKPVTPKAPVTDLDAMINGAIYGILFHELGHGLIAELKLPIPGSEEDVADEFASFMFVNVLKNQDKAGPGAQSVVKLGALGSALVWFGLAQQPDDSPWWGEHSPNMIRFGKIICILYGAAPDLYAPVMDAAQIPQERRDRCVYDFPRKWEAWQTLLRPHIRNLDQSFPGDLPADAPGGIVRLQVVPARSAFGRQMERVVKPLAAATTSSMSRYFVFPRDITIVFQDCDVANAWWNPEAGTVTMCYEMVEIAAQLLVQMSDQEAPAGQPLGQAQGGGASATGPGQSLVGQWEGPYMDATGPSIARFVLNADGSYRLLLNYSQINQTLTIQGRWQVKPGDGNRAALQIQPRQWTPTEICANNRCEPVKIEQETLKLTLIDPNTIGTSYGILRRIP